MGKSNQWSGWGWGGGGVETAEEKDLKQSATKAEGSDTDGEEGV